MRLLSSALLVACLGLSGCLAAPHADVPAPPALPATAPAMAYLHDLSPMAHPDLASTPFVLDHNSIPVGEDVILDSYVWRPATSDKVPVILTVTPYYGGGSPAATQTNPVGSPLGNPVGMLANDFVPRGYAVGFVSVEGTGDSTGCFTQGGPLEAQHIATAIDYYGTQAWSNGNVGMIGVSYDGTTPQETWVQAPSHLKAVVPISGISDLYKYSFMNGIPLNVQGFGFNTYYWAIVGAGPAGLEGGVGPTDPQHFAMGAANEACPDQVDVQKTGVQSTLTGDKGPYWMERDFLARLKATPDKERAPVLYVHGLQDYNVKDHNMDGWLAAIQDTGVPFKALLGQWQHAWPDNSLAAGNCKVSATPPPPTDPPKPTCRADWWNGTLVAWFDQTLKGRDTGIYAMPRMQVQDDNGTWRHEARWPPVPDRTWVLHPDHEGKLGTTDGRGQASYYDYQGDLTAAAPVGLPANNGQGSVLFVSDPVKVDTHISGIPTFDGNVTATGKRASLVLTLAERLADGSDRSINFAGQSLNHVQNAAQGQTDISNQRQFVHVDFLPSDDVIHAGDRLVLYAAGNTVGSDYGGTPALQPVSDGSTITIDLPGSRLTLPIDTSIAPEVPQPFEP